MGLPAKNFLKKIFETLTGYVRVVFYNKGTYEAFDRLYNRSIFSCCKSTIFDTKELRKDAWLDLQEDQSDQKGVRI